MEEAKRRGLRARAKRASRALARLIMGRDPPVGPNPNLNPNPNPNPNPN